jgi:hypothetical protein
MRKRETVVDIEMRKKNWAVNNKKEMIMNPVARNAGIEYSKRERKEIRFYFENV